MDSNTTSREELDVFQEIMLDVFQRRAIFEAIEERMLGRTLKDETVYRVYIRDYVGSQLADLRKFFESDNRSYRIINLTKTLPPRSKARGKHTELFKIWKKDYEDLANKYYFHRERNVIPAKEVIKSKLNYFMDQVSLMLDDLVDDLTSSGQKVNYLERGVNSSYYLDIKDSAEKFYQRL